MKKFRICEGDEIGQKTGEEAEKEEDAEQTARAKITCKKCMNKAQIERKRYKMKKLITLVLALVMCLNLGACGKKENNPNQGNDSDTTALKDTITIGHYLEPISLDPQTNGVLACFMVEIQIYDTLILEQDGEITPMLAKSWEFLDDTTLRFTLRDDVYFHNGEKMTAEDVLFTIYRATTDAGSASTFSSVDYDKCKVVDEYTFDLALKAPNASIFNTLGTPRGSIICKSAYEEMGGDAYARNPIGTGPYKFVSWMTGSEIRLVRNEEYWGDKALTENVVYKFITESATRLVELETGGCDIIDNVQASEVELLEATDGLKVLMGPSYAYNTITFNMQDEVLSNPLVRQALAYATDKAAITEAFYPGTGDTATGIMPLTIFGSKETAGYPYDVEKAKELLAEAGYANGLELNFVVQSNEELLRITEAVQNMWKDVGVTCNITTSEVAAYLASGNKLQVAIRNGSASDPSNTLIIYESSFGDRINSNDAKLDEMIAEARTHYDAAERKAAYNEICDYLSDACYTIPLVFKYNILACSDKVSGYEFDPLSWNRMCYVTVAEN